VHCNDYITESREQYSRREMVICAGLNEVNTSLTNIQTTLATLRSQRTALNTKITSARTNAGLAIGDTMTGCACITLRTSLNTLAVVAPTYMVIWVALLFASLRIYYHLCSHSLYSRIIIQFNPCDYW